jgi:UDP-GlcNAc3NAcA epimerase
LRIATVLGARPQFVKASVVSRALRESGADELIIHTGQHYDDDLSKVFFDELEIPEPHVNLGVGSGPHGAQTGRMLEGIETVLFEEKPDYVLVYGDTNSTVAGALAATKMHLPVAHIEAGLRSYNRRMPEEINRVLTDHIAEELFAPTETAVVNLLREGIELSRIHAVGDTMYDASLHFADKARERSRILEQLSLGPHEYLMMTVHRAENTDDPVRLQNICDALAEASEFLPVVWPVHPRTRHALARLGLAGSLPKQMKLISPVGYLDMVMLEMNARVIATDSGGVQKEAYFYGVPCVTLRDETEWVELLELGWNRLACPTSVRAITTAITDALSGVPRAGSDPYGNGDSARRIVETLITKGRESRKRAELSIT